MRLLDLDRGPITHLAFRPDGKTLGVCFHEGFALLNLPEVLAGVVNPRFTPSRDRVAEMAWHPTGRCFALAGAEGIVQIHSADGHKQDELVGLPGQQGPMTSVAFSPDGKHLALGGGWWDEPGRAVVVTDYYWQPVGELTGHENQIGAVLFAGPESIVTGGADRRVLVHHVRGGRLAEVHLVGAQVHALAISPRADWLAVALGRRIELWPLNESGQPESASSVQCKGHTHPVRAVAFSPDGRTIASVSEDSSLRTWNAADGVGKMNLEPRGGPARTVAFSPDGLLIALAGKEGKLILMDAD